MEIKNKRQILTTILAVLIPVFLVTGVVFAVTIIGTNVSTDGNLTVDGNVTLGDANTDAITANSSLTITGGTVTADAPVINATQTWNAGAVTFNGIKINVTDGASAAPSLLADLQVGGASKFKVDKTGVVTAAGGLTVTAGTVALPNGEIGTAELAAGAVTKAKTGYKSVDVTVALGVASGSSANDPDLVGGEILGIYPTGNQDQFVDNVVLDGNGKVTVTLAAAATADNTFKVVVLKP